jgi:hypothetical protein
MKRIVLQPIGDGLHEIVSGKHFIVRKLSNGNKLSAAFIFLMMLLIPQLFAMYLILNFTFRSLVSKI